MARGDLRGAVLAVSLAAIMAQCSPDVHASDVPRVEITDECGPDMDALAIAALRRLQSEPDVQRWEYGGMILQVGADYCLTTTATQQHGRKVAVRAQTNGAALAAFFHTHPTDESTARYFSQTDIETARQIGGPVYMLHVASGTVYRWIPGNPTFLMRRTYERVAKGEQVK